MKPSFHISWLHGRLFVSDKNIFSFLTELFYREMDGSYLCHPTSFRIIPIVVLVR